MAADGTTKITIKGIDEISDTLKKIQGNLSDMNKTDLTKLAISFDAITMAAQTAGKIISQVVKTGKELVNAYGVQQTAEVKLQAVLRATGNQYNTSLKALKEYASNLQKLTTFGDEATLGAEQVLLATQSLSKDGFERAIKLSADLATAMGTDITSAADTLAIALQDPVQGLTRLRRQGVAFTDAEKSMIQSMQDAGDMAGAQSAVMDKLESKYKGIAEDVANTDTGKLQQMKNILGDIKEDLGGALLDTISPALETLYGWLVRIEQKASSLKNDVEYNDMINGFWNGGQDYSVEQLVALKNYIANDKYTQGNGFVEVYNPEHPLRPSHISLSGYNYAIDEAIKDKGGWFGTTPQVPAVSSVTPTTAEPVSSLVTTKDYSSLFSKSTTYKVDQINKQIAEANIALNTATDQEKEYIYEAMDSLMEERDKLLKAPSSISWVDKLTDGLSYASSVIGTLTSSFADMWDSQADAVEAEYEAEKENGELTLEEEKKKQDEINRIRKKAFIADKMNSIAQATISGAQAIIGFMKDPGGYAGIALSAVAGVTTAAQIATIAGQAYTPSYAQGAYDLPQDQLAQVHQGEMIIPKPFAEDIRNGNGIGGCTVNIYVQGNADEEVIFNAIERAQRTGYLPSWSYT